MGHRLVSAPSIAVGQLDRDRRGRKGLTPWPWCRSAGLGPQPAHRHHARNGQRKRRPQTSLLMNRISSPQAFSNPAYTLMTLRKCPKGVMLPHAQLLLLARVFRDFRAGQMIPPTSKSALAHRGIETNSDDPSKSGFAFDLAETALSLSVRGSAGRGRGFARRGRQFRDRPARAARRIFPSL